MKTSITTILWGKIHTLGEFRKVLAEVRKIGYDGIGLETRLLPLEMIKDPKLVKRTLKEARVENSGSYSTMKLQDVDWASQAGTPVLWVVARGDNTYRDALGVLRGLKSRAVKSGIAIALHNHLGTRFETEAQMRRALTSVKGLQVCFDTAHAEAADFDTPRFIRDFHDRIALVHVKDLRVKVSKANVSYTKDFVNAGEGILNFRKIFGALKDAGYDGNLMLETEVIVGRRPGEVAKEGYDRIQSLLREA
ncbi:MAG TPA: sugar phosphate isomerase/epimerase [Nitrososphaerales archaeon]|nr:sugar phosphate isomerase/epimerase [Nitrososphaerales archaeon]